MIGDTLRVPHKVRLTVEKYAPGHEPDGNPDEIVSVESWHDADGTEITDLAHIAELEAGIARQEGVPDGANERIS